MSTEHGLWSEVPGTSSTLSRPRSSSATHIFHLFLVASVSAFGLRILSSDIKIAYLQSTEPLARLVLSKNPATKFKLKLDESLLLWIFLYVLRDAGGL